MTRYAGTFLLLALPQLASAAAGVADVAETDPGLFMFMMMALVVFTGIVLLSILLFAVLAVFVMLPIGTGLFSVSIFVGWYHRSFGKGISTFLQLSFILGGAAAVGGLLSVLAAFQPSWVATGFCSFIVIAGATAGWMCFRIIRQLSKLFVQKLQTAR